MRTADSDESVVWREAEATERKRICPPPADPRTRDGRRGIKRQTQLTPNAAANTKANHRRAYMCNSCYCTRPETLDNQNFGCPSTED